MSREKPGQPHEQEPKVIVSESYGEAVRLEVGPTVADAPGVDKKDRFQDLQTEYVRLLDEQKQAEDRARQDNTMFDAKDPAELERRDQEKVASRQRAEFLKRQADLLNKLGRNKITPEERKELRAFFDQRLSQEAQQLVLATEMKNAQLDALHKKDPEAITEYMDMEAVIAEQEARCEKMWRGQERLNPQVEKMRQGIAAFREAQRYSKVGSIQEPWRKAQERVARAKKIRGLM